MQSKHAKSPCCAARVRRFGPRRRRCVECGKTWRVRPKKRGRPVHRRSPALLHRVLVKGYTLGQLFSHRTTVALPAYRYRFRQALQRWVARPQPQKIPGGPLVLLTDGLWFEFEGIPWVLYLVALKPCRGHQATFLDPLLLPGREGASRWQQAVEAIPSPARKRVRAIVADNLPGIEKIAHQHRWVLQLCHFHLLLKLQAPRRRVRYALRGGAVREEIYQSIRNALLLPNGRRLAQTLERLKRAYLVATAEHCGSKRCFASSWWTYRSIVPTSPILIWAYRSPLTPSNPCAACFERCCVAVGRAPIPALCCSGPPHSFACGPP